MHALSIGEAVREHSPPNNVTRFEFRPWQHMWVEFVVELVGSVGSLITFHIIESSNHNPCRVRANILKIHTHDSSNTIKQDGKHCQCSLMLLGRVVFTEAIL